MNAPILLALAPGDDAVAGRIVSPISSSNAKTSSLKPSTLVSLRLHPERKACEPIMAEPIKAAVAVNASRLFIINSSYQLILPLLITHYSLLIIHCSQVLFIQF